MSVAAAVRALSTDPAVEYAEPNWIYQHADASNDTYYTNGSLWGMYGDATIPANQYGTQAGEAWAAGNTTCGNVYVGIIDEGYMYTHEDLAANAGTNPGEVAGNGVDDDGNGYVDDVYGWDFAGGDNTRVRRRQRRPRHARGRHHRRRRRQWQGRRRRVLERSR